MSLPRKSLPSSSLEPLEQRIAPASLVFTSSADENQKVTVTISKGSLEALTSALSAMNVSGQTYTGEQFIFALDLTNSPSFRGANITVATAGGATTLLQTLDATGFDLGQVMIQGELGRILAGDNHLETPAVKSLSAESLGITEAGASTLHGSLTKLSVTGDMGGALNLETRAGSLGTVAIGGKLLGSAASDTGLIKTGGGIKSLTITGGLQGGNGERSGSVFARGPIVSATVGSIFGGMGSLSGNLSTDSSLFQATVNGSVNGDAHAESGASNGKINAGLFLGRISITGSVLGGFAGGSGEVSAGRGIVSVAIAGVLQGGSGFESGTVGSAGKLQLVTVGTQGVEGPRVDRLVGGSGEKSGAILSSAKISKVEIFGNVIGGSGPDSASIDSIAGIDNVMVHGSIRGGTGTGSGSIGSLQALGTIAVDGDLVGQGEMSARIVSKTSIRSATIGGSVLGGAGEESGSIGTLGNLGAITVGVNLAGGAGYHSGSLLAAKTLQTVHIGQSVIGYTGGETDGADTLIQANSLGVVTVGGSMLGGANQSSGSILAKTFASLSIEGSLQGGQGAGSARILIDGLLKHVSIGGNLTGGGGSVSGSLVAGRIEEVVIGGNMNAGRNFAGAIIASRSDIGSVKVGSINSTADSNGAMSAYILAARNVGSVSAESIQGLRGGSVFIVAGGNAEAKNKAEALAIGTVTTEKMMAYTQVLAGYQLAAVAESQSVSLEPVNGHVQIGTVEVGTDGTVASPWQGNDVSAGAAMLTSGSDIAAGGNPAILSSIARVIIHGDLANSVDETTHIIIAEQINSAKVGTPLGVFPLQAGAHNDFQYFPVANDPTFSTLLYEIGAGS